MICSFPKNQNQNQDQNQIHDILVNKSHQTIRIRIRILINMLRGQLTVRVTIVIPTLTPPNLSEDHLAQVMMA